MKKDPSLLELNVVLGIASVIIATGAIGLHYLTTPKAEPTESRTEILNPQQDICDDLKRATNSELFRIQGIYRGLDIADTQLGLNSEQRKGLFKIKQRTLETEVIISKQIGGLTALCLNKKDLITYPTSCSAFVIQFDANTQNDIPESYCNINIY